MTDKDGGLLGLGANLIGDTLGMGGTTRDPAEPGRYMGDIPDYIMREVVNQRMSAMANAHQTAQIHPPPPLTKPPSYYLTGDEGSPCDKPEPIRCGKFKWQIEKMPPETKEDIDAKFDPDVEIKRIMGIDTDKFRKECLEESGVIDEDVYMKLKDKGE